MDYLLQAISANRIRFGLLDAEQSEMEHLVPNGRLRKNLDRRSEFFSVH